MKKGDLIEVRQNPHHNWEKRELIWKSPAGVYYCRHIDMENDLVPWNCGREIKSEPFWGRKWLNSELQHQVNIGQVGNTFVLSLIARERKHLKLDLAAIEALTDLLIERRNK